MLELDGLQLQGQFFNISERWTRMVKVSPCVLS